MRLRLPDLFHAPDPAERLHLEQDIDEELRFHLEMRRLENESEGMDADTAVQAAMDQFGNIARIQAECLAIKSENPFGKVWRSAQLVGGITLCSGILCLLFLIFNAAHYRLPLTYQGDGNWVAVWWIDAQEGLASVSSYENYRSILENQTSFEAMTAVLYKSFFLGSETGPPQKVQAKLVSEDYFMIHGAPPILGTSFDPIAYEAGQPVPVILSYDFWSRRFDRDREVVGRTLTINGKESTIIGVAPANFRMYFPTDIFIPLRFGLIRDHTNRFLLVSGKSRKGITHADATAELRRLTAYESSRELILRPVQDVYSAPVRRTLIAYLTMAFLVLILVCIHFSRRQLYMPFDRLLQSTKPDRLKNMLLFLVPPIGLAVIAGLVGAIALAKWALPYLTGNFSHLYDVRPDYTLALFGILLVLFTCLLVCIIPWALLRIRASTCKSPGKLSARSWYSCFSVVEIALAFTMCVIAILLMQEAWVGFHEKPGYNPDDVLALSMSMPPYRLETPTAQAKFMQEVFRKLDTIEGIDGASISSLLPDRVSAEHVSWFTFSDNKDAQKHEIYTSHVGVDYIQLMGIPLLEGRYFNLLDMQSVKQPVIINRSMAETYWPGVNPVGKHLYTNHSEISWEVVGVVGNLSASNSPTKTPPLVYQFYWRTGCSEFKLILKTNESPHAMMAAVKKAIWSIDPEVPLQQATWLPEVEWNRLKAQKSTLFGFLCLTIVGFLIATHCVIYGIRQNVEWRIYQIRKGYSSEALIRWLHIFQSQLLHIMAGVLVGLLASHHLIHHYLHPIFGLQLVEGVHLGVIVSCLGLGLAIVALASSARYMSLRDVLPVRS